MIGPVCQLCIAPETPRILRPGMIFLSLLALDIASHWLQMYSSFLVGKASHKDVKDSSSWLFKLYYGNRKFMGYCCVSCEVLYIVLFLLAENQTENLTEVLVNAATQSWLYLTLLSLSFIGWVIKQIVNVIQLQMHAYFMTLAKSGRKQTIGIYLMFQWRSICGLADRVLVVESPKDLKPVEHALRKKSWAALVMRSLVEVTYEYAVMALSNG
ncbi:UNVERIFIED_CONTAM: putative CDP-diacylglycerol--inositol 3-phosphatidyltransferase 2 [Sesamum calycinum]|uniref:CDP-diacylglycerol--inositol 3-phosphatidyltransferase 2 n=1 Tax=Sesamum calycinum TaxID=2727403 RepID=A0AAW2R814_9LAMI